MNPFFSNLLLYKFSFTESNFSKYLNDNANPYKNSSESSLKPTSKSKLSKHFNPFMDLATANPPRFFISLCWILYPPKFNSKVLIVDPIISKQSAKA